MIKQTPAHIKAAAIIASVNTNIPIIITTNIISVVTNDYIHTFQIIDKQNETFNGTIDTTPLLNDITHNLNNKDNSGNNCFHFIYLFKDDTTITTDAYHLNTLRAKYQTNIVPMTKINRRPPTE